ncbi:hypothetical protein [Bacillus massiliglaciei]|uniref:hypothetical protein n=1 Tax=Bacillus massiliglaciei TaxID=1816693 RepID=UPI000DA5F6FF|nr:hypothetical protein [Bacillus massiliglaciei]
MWKIINVLYTNPEDPEWGEDYSREVPVYNGEWIFEETCGEVTFRKITGELSDGTLVVNVGDCYAFYLAWSYKINLDWLMDATFKEIVEKLATK